MTEALLANMTGLVFILVALLGAARSLWKKQVVAVFLYLAFGASLIAVLSMVMHVGVVAQSDPTPGAITALLNERISDPSEILSATGWFLRLPFVVAIGFLAIAVSIWLVQKAISGVHWLNRRFADKSASDIESGSNRKAKLPRLRLAQPTGKVTPLPTPASADADQKTGSV